MSDHKSHQRLTFVTLRKWVLAEDEWVWLEDKHPDVLSDAFMVHMYALLHSTELLHDGAILRLSAEKVAPIGRERSRAAIAALIDVGLWADEDQDGRYQVNMYERYSKPAREIMARREKDAERKRERRAEESNSKPKTVVATPPLPPAPQDGDCEGCGGTLFETSRVNAAGERELVLSCEADQGGCGRHRYRPVRTDATP